MTLLEQALLRIPKPSVWKGQKVVVAEEKKNGINCTIERNGSGAKAVGRKTYINLWPSMERDVSLRDAVYSLPLGTVVNGELWVPGGKSADVRTALNAGEGFKFTAHTMPFFSGIYQRNCPIHEVRRTLRDHDFDLVEQIPWLQSQNWNFDAQQLLTEAERLGWEGWVLKEEHLFGWYKVKVLHTVDVVVLSTKPGNGKFAGGIGSFDIGLYDGDDLVSVGTVSAGCWEDEDRKALGDHDIGRVMEVRYQDVLSKGRLQHSVFVSWRDDKPAKECSIEQIQ